jgi:site-specific recombinase XerD
MHDVTFETSIERFLHAIEGENKSQATIGAYACDLRQFVTWLRDTNIVAATPHQVTKADICEYLSELAQQGNIGLTRARKLAAIREYFRFLVSIDLLTKSPAEHVATPKKEKHTRNSLSRAEYSQLLAQAGAHLRDYAMLQTFLQTGLRVSELCNLELQDIDVAEKLLHVRAGKGQSARTIELEKKVIAALKSYMRMRPNSEHPYLFLNKDAAPFSRQGVAKLVRKYLKLAEISKKVSTHSLRHTFATVKADKGASPYRLQQWLGHKDLRTTQIYVHLARSNASREMEATSL